MLFFFHVKNWFKELYFNMQLLEMEGRYLSLATSFNLFDCKENSCMEFYSNPNVKI